MGKKNTTLGRPSKLTPEILETLREAFTFGCSDREALLYVQDKHDLYIAESTLYDYQNREPEFLEQKRRLKERPTMKARSEVVKGLENNPEFSLKYLERKRRKEFAIRSEVDMAAEVTTTLTDEDKALLKGFIKDGETVAPEE